MTVVTTFDQLVARVRGLEHRSQRAEEDIASIIDTVVETGEDVKVLKHDVKWLKREMRESRDDIDSLKSDMRENRGDVAVLKDDVGWLKQATQALLDHN